MAAFRDKIIDIKHNSKILTRLWYVFRMPRFIIKERIKQKEAENRAGGYRDIRFEGIKKYKGLHTGERCFIIATGPSLRIADVEMLFEEYTFGMNSICKIFDDTSWRPTYFGIQDCNVYEKLEQTILDVYGHKDNVFVSDIIAERFKIPDNFQQFPWDAVYHDNQLEIDRYFARFSEDCYSIVYDGYSITYSLLQIAIYMGFKEIYLLGADCSYKRGAQNHFAESGFVDKNEEKNHDKMITGYKEAKKYADTHSIRIVNCTRGGMLEVFPRMSLEEVLKEKEHNK